MNLRPENPLLPDRQAGVAALQLVEKFDWAMEILSLRDAFCAVCFNFLSGMSMMVDMPLFPGVLHGAGNSMAINHIPLGTRRLLFI
jgi:hypothetical protein